MIPAPERQAKSFQFGDGWSGANNVSETASDSKLGCAAGTLGGHCHVWRRCCCFTVKARSGELSRLAAAIGLAEKRLDAKVNDDHVTIPILKPSFMAGRNIGYLDGWSSELFSQFHNTVAMKAHMLWRQLPCGQTILYKHNRPGWMMPRPPPGLVGTVFSHCAMLRGIDTWNRCYDGPAPGDEPESNHLDVDTSGASFWGQRLAFSPVFTAEKMPHLPRSIAALLIETCWWACG